MQRRIEVILSNVFYLLFCGQILSPAVGNVTIYLENLVALANPFFLSWLIARYNNAQALLMALLLVTFSVATGDAVLVFKLVAFFISIAYIMYTYERQMFYLFRYVALSAILAILQFSLIFVDPGLAYNVGPTSISTALWGKYATGTFTNFYTIFAFARVSGLSREGGFLATLVLNCIIIYVVDPSLARYKSRWILTLLIVAFVLSFSKMSLLLIPALLVFKFRRWIDRIPLPVIPVVVTLFLIRFWAGYVGFLTDDDNGTYLQRFGGYVALADLDTHQLLFGIDHLGQAHSYVAQAALSMPYENFDYFAGFAGYILGHGLIVTALTVAMLWLLGVSSAGFLMLLVLTMNVDITTNQNFVTLTYFMIFTYLSNGGMRLFHASPKASLPT